MRRTPLLILCVIGVGLIPTASGRACSRMRPFTLDELFNNAEVIVRATAVKYAKPPDDPRIMTTGVPDSTIEFRVEEKLKGSDVPSTIILNGYLSDKDDFNEMPVPYMFVRPLGRRGSCFANTYKGGAQFLLFLKKTGDLHTPNTSALGPTNEQLHSDADTWLVWVRDHLTAEKARESAADMNWLAMVAEFPFVLSSPSNKSLGRSAGRVFRKLHCLNRRLDVIAATGQPRPAGRSASA